ncbi:MAG: MFS transporter [Candidatus Hydrothermia bacterium]
MFRVIGVVLFYFAYGCYYVLLKPRFIDLNASYFQILLIDSLPALVALTSILWGRLADIISRRVFLFLSALGGVVIVSFAYFNSIFSLLTLLGILSIFSSMAIPVINALFSFEEEVEKSFASYLLAEAMGWSISGVFMGIFSKSTFTVRIAYWIAGISWIFGILILAMDYHDGSSYSHKESSKYRPSVPFIFLMAAILFLEFGIVTSYGVLSVKLYETLNKSRLLYGIFWATLPSIASVLVSKPYGDLIKRITPWNSLILIAAVYMINIILLMFSKGFLMAFLWILPLWNFVYIALYSSVSKLTEEEHRATGFGITNSILNLAMVLSAFGGYFSDKYGRNAGILMGVSTIFVATILFFVVKGLVKNLLNDCDKFLT